MCIHLSLPHYVVTVLCIIEAIQIKGIALCIDELCVCTALCWSVVLWKGK